MHTRLLTGLIASGMLFAPLGLAADQQQTPARHTMSPDMRRAIEFQRHKDQADARQERTEARHPTVFYNHAERSAEEAVPPGRSIVHEPGEPQSQQQQQNEKTKKEDRQFERQP